MDVQRQETVLWTIFELEVNSSKLWYYILFAWNPPPPPLALFLLAQAQHEKTASQSKSHL